MASQTTYARTSAAPQSALRDFSFELVYLPTIEITWSRTFPEITRVDPASFDKMTSAVVSAVGDVHTGAIMADQLRRAATSNAPLRGYACRLQAYDYS